MGNHPLRLISTYSGFLRPGHVQQAARCVKLEDLTFGSPACSWPAPVFTTRRSDK
jgi:hypothetical protein